MLQEQDGIAMPQVYRDRPEIDPHLVGVWQAFTVLSRRRQVGMAANPISIGEMFAYLDGFGIYGEARQHMVTLISALDDEWLKGRS